MLFHTCLNKSKDFQLIINSFYVDIVRGCDRKVDFIRNMPFRISCFSNFNDEEELGKNTTMWSHYADNHTGFCIKYSTKFNSEIYNDVIRCGLFPVIYTSRIPKLTLQDFKSLRFSGDRLVLEHQL